MNILIFGHQGSGKTTHGKYIAEKLDLEYLSTGDILRSITTESTPLAEKVRQHIDNGLLIDDQLMWDIISSRFSAHDDGYVLDGFPRTLNQIQIMKHNKSHVDVVFYIHVDYEVSYKRLLARGRHDDTPEKIEKRLELYKTLTKPLFEQFKSEDIQVIHIDNNGTIEETRNQIDDRLKELK